ncbi:hypothetical protein PSN45_001055 [Yamadazyma tenuis]
MSTIYINNLNEKVSANTLKRELQHLLKPYNVIDIHVKKTLRKKGQAFVSFKNENIDNIIRKLNNHVLLNKSIRVTHAKQNSYELLDQITIDSRIQVKKHKFFNTPSSMLILNDYNEDTISKDQILEVFDRFEGYLELRVIKNKKIVFIDFEKKEFAASCLNDVSLDDMQRIGGKLSFAKQ